MNTFVSVIITTKNEEAVIEPLLQSIHVQSYKHKEIIIVDNASTDNTVRIAKKYTNLVYQQGPERSTQRNYGARKSHGDILLFLDADMVLQPDVITECVDEIKRGSISVVIPEKSVGNGFWAKVKALERSCYLNVDWIESARCFTKKAFETVGGYDESMSGPEDFDFPQRVKKHFGKETVGRIDSFIIHNEGRLRLKELLKRKYYYGKSMPQYLAKPEQKQQGIKQGNVIQRYILFLKHWPLIFKDPLVYCAVYIMKTLEIASLALGTLEGSKKLHEKHH